MSSIGSEENGLEISCAVTRGDLRGAFTGAY